MKKRLLNYLCDPIDKSPLKLIDPTFDQEGNILGGILVSDSDRRYPIVDGIPRFVKENGAKSSVASFGREWNYFNFDQFKANWLEQTVKNTFGSVNAFRNKVIIDAYFSRPAPIGCALRLFK